jgi:integrase
MKLTKANIGALELPAGKADHIEFDEDMPGFGLRLRKGGKRVWVVQYKIGAKQRRKTIGTIATLDPAAARKQAGKELAEVKLGKDPQEAKFAARAKAKVTLGAVVDSYLNAQKQRLRPKTFEETERYLRKVWKPLHGMQFHQIERRNVAAELREIIDDEKPIKAARARAALSMLFAWAIGEGYADQNAVIGTNKPDQDTVPRDRVLSDAELVEIWKACGNDDYGRIIKLLMLTAQRRDEVGAMAESEIDRKQGIWTIPAARAKNNREHSLALPQFAFSIIEQQIKLREPETDGCLFGLGESGYGGWSKSKVQLDQRILEARKKVKAGKVQSMPPWVVHDLRRTVATRMADLGVLPHVIEALLNHVSGHKGGVAGIYNRSSYEREVRAALALWADHIRSILIAEPPQLVSLEKAKRSRQRGP